MSGCKNHFVLITLAFVPALVFAVGLTSSAVGQISPGVPANFGVDADLQADTTQFGGLGIGLTTDDWFDPKPGAGFEGIGVTDTTGGGAFRALILPGGAAANRTFVRHMAFPFGEIVNGSLFLDAVYARDNHSAGGEVDSTVFLVTGEKNIDNPRTWLMAEGSTPPKKDIVDACAHIRRDGDEPADSLWVLTAMSTMASSGDANIDFELFRSVDTLLSGANMFDGPDSGRTAWSVARTGDLLAGDLIFSVDFQTGGVNPIVGIRIWIRDGDQAAIEAASDIVFSGIFYGGGEDGGDFGYADLVVPAGAAFARVNGLAMDPVDSTLAAPWGSLEGPEATFHDYVLALQLAESGINLTALGLDPNATGDPSADLSRYILFKTRSSQSFTAELSDFVGPHLFGQVKVPYGDANGDGIIDLADVVYLLNYLFKGDDPPEPLEAGDANCDGIVDLADVVYLLNYLFKGGTQPSC
jgi:hypothetical protein